MTEPVIQYPKWVKIGFIGGLTFILIASILSLLDFLFDLEFLWYLSFICIATGLVSFATSLQYAQQYMIDAIKTEDKDTK